MSDVIGGTASPDALASPFAGAAWRGVMRRQDALPSLPREILLHAGPPLAGEGGAAATMVPAPIRRAALQAILFEGMADTLDDAAVLLDSGAVRLEPAQDHGVATPLAQVVSASMPLAVVGDAHRLAFAPLIEGPPPALRFGTLAPEALDRLAAVSALGLEQLDAHLRAWPVNMATVIAAALRGGDECHARTGVANAALVSALGASPHGTAAAGMGGAVVATNANTVGATDAAAAAAVAGAAGAAGAAGNATLDGDVIGYVAGNPGFVLPILMATACWHLRRQTDGIAAVGGNGASFGVRLHGTRAWHTVAATPPVGTRLAGREAVDPLGAIGDSAVIDFCGLGGQALAYAPQLLEEWRTWLPTDALDRRAQLVDDTTGIVSLTRMRAKGLAPIVNLAILDRDGEAGLIGRGSYMPSLALANVA